MKYKLINTNNIETLIQEIDIVIENSFTPTLAFIFPSVRYNIKHLVKKLKKYKFVIIGATTYGEIYADNLMGVNINNQSISCMLLNLNPSTFSLKIKEKNNLSHYEFGKKMATWCKEKFDFPEVLTLTSGLAFNNESYIEGLQTNIKNLFGAVAGDDNLFIGTYVFSQQKIIKSGALVLVFDRSKIEIISSRSFGWSGIGTQRIVTKSNENIVYTIDDKPAIEFYQDYLNICSSEMPSMGVDYPMEVKLRNGQIVYRSALHINKDGSLVFAGHVKEGSKVRISAPIGNEIIEYVKNSIKMKQNFKADFTLLFPCASHKNLLGSQAVKEIEAVYRQVNAPLVGFYAYGEIASSKNENNAFHNETFVTVQFKEK